MKLTDRVHLVGSGMLGFGLTDRFDCNVYLLDGGDSLALVDAGAGLDQVRILDQVRADGFDPARIEHVILTHQHADHAGGAAGFRKALGARVCLSAASARLLREGDEAGVSLAIAKRAGAYPAHYRYSACPVDLELRHGDAIAVGDLSLRVLDTPGHCHSHQSFALIHDDRTYLFGGDLIFHGGQILLQNIPDCSIGDYAASLESLRNLGVDVLLPGHLCPDLANGQRHIEAAANIFAGLLIPRNLV